MVAILIDPVHHYSFIHFVMQNLLLSWGFSENLSTFQFLRTFPLEIYKVILFFFCLLCLVNSWFPCIYRLTEPQIEQLFRFHQRWEQQSTFILRNCNRMKPENTGAVYAIQDEMHENLCRSFFHSVCFISLFVYPRL